MKREKIFNLNYDYWIYKNEKIFNHFGQLWQQLKNLPDPFLQEKIKNTKVEFMFSRGSFSCTISTTGIHPIIIIFPDLYNLLLDQTIEKNRLALAILAHELGHIYSLNKNIENEQLADLFVLKLGYKKELLNLLSSLKELYPNCKQRYEFLLNY